MEEAAAGFLCLGVFCLLPLALAIAALASLERTKGTLKELRKQIALLEAQVSWLAERSKSAAPATSANPQQEATTAPPVTVAAPPAPQPAPPPAPAAPVPASPMPEPAAKEEAFARITGQLPELVPGPEPELPPIDEPAPSLQAGAPSMEEPPVAVPPPAPAVPLEQRVIRLAVAVGGVALALAGIFLVKVAFDRNYLSPPVRVLLGTLFGLALLGAGIWRRKKEEAIAQALSAAAIADLFACFLAATNLYHLVSPVTGFLLLAATTALAVVLSLAQGPFVALLGLIGGFLTPALIHTEHPSALSLFGYLFLLHVGLTLVTRSRHWQWLAALTVLASQAWVLLWMITEPWSAADGQILGFFVLLSAFAVLGASAWEESEEQVSRADLAWARGLSYLALLIGLALSAALLSRSHFSNTEWAFLGLLSAACFVLAGLRAAYEPLAWAAAALVWIMLANAGQDVPATGVPRLAVILSIFGAAFSLASYGMLWRPAASVRWAALSVISALGYSLLAYWILPLPPRPEVWAWLPVGVAVVYAALSVPIYQRRAALRDGEDILDTLVTGALTALAIAPPMAFEHATLTAVWSLLVPLSVAVARRLRLHGPWILLLLVGAIVGIRLVINPFVLTYDTGPSLWWNPVVWGYLPSAAALFVAVALIWHWRRPTDKVAEDKVDSSTIAAFLEITGCLIVAAFATVFTHLIFHRDSLSTTAIPFHERIALGNVWILLGMLMIALGDWLRRLRSETLGSVGYLILSAAALFVLFIDGLLLNPLWTADNLGTGWINALWPLFGLPAALLGATAFWQRRKDGAAAAGLTTLTATASLLLLFLLITLQIRCAFNGPVIDISSREVPAARIAERATYPLAWLLLGFSLMVCARKGRFQGMWLAGQLFAGAGTVCVVIVSILAFNPLSIDESVGAVPVFNCLLYAYGAPALVAAILGVWLFHTADPGPAGDSDRVIARAHGIAALLFLFFLVSLEVRQAFHGPDLHAVTRPSSAEMYAYSAAWAIFGTLLLIGGILTRGPILRWASLAVMLLTILKVFLFDMANLSDLFRVLSFAGLGISLILLALLYHYFVFGRAPARTDPAPPAAPPAPSTAAPIS